MSLVTTLGLTADHGAVLAVAVSSVVFVTMLGGKGM
jgi:hypothetical protein